jgi:hypothetical protein
MDYKRLLVSIIITLGIVLAFMATVWLIANYTALVAQIVFWIVVAGMVSMVVAIIYNALE